jgi:hypothetical protein
MISIEHSMRDFMEWAPGAYPEATEHSSLEKLDEELKELKEVLNSDGDTEHPPHQLPEEYVDCIMCLLHSAKKAGINFSTLQATFNRKFEMNKRRTWIKNSNNTYSHLK